jgi:hypothetical protein
MCLLIVGDVKPSTTVTYTGAELTSYLLNGGGVQTKAKAVSPTTTGGKSAMLVAGTEFSRPWDAAATSTSSSSSSDQTQTATSASSAMVSSTMASSTAVASQDSVGSSSVKLSTGAIVGIVVGTVGLLAIIALILFLLARHKRAKDRQRLRDNATADEKYRSNPSSPRGKGAVVPIGSESTDPFHDDNTDKTTTAKGPVPLLRKQSDITSFDFGGLVPTKNNYGKDGKPIINSTWDENGLGRPFSLGRVPSPSSTVAEVGDETPMDFTKHVKTPSPTKEGVNMKTPPQNSAGVVMNIKRKTPPQNRPSISQPISPIKEKTMWSDSPLRAAPVPDGMNSTASSNSIASTVSSLTTRKPRPSPIQVPPLRSPTSRDSIIIDKNISPPMTLPPSIPTPPLPSMEFRKEWESLKRESSASVDSTDTTILDEADSEMDAEAKPEKTPLQDRQSLTNMPVPTRNSSVKSTLQTVITPSSPSGNAGDILKKEKTLLRAPSTSTIPPPPSIPPTLTNTINPPNKRSPSIVAATAKWAEKRKALNAQLANQHNRNAAKNDPLPNNAAEKVQEARKSSASLVAAADIDENRDTLAIKRDVEGRKGVSANVTESIGSPTLSVFKCYDPDRESTWVPGEDLQRLRMDMEDKENVPIAV